jgi:hypothetical protein
MKKLFLLNVIVILFLANTLVLAEDINTRAINNINFKDSPKEVFEKVLDNPYMHDALHYQSYEYNNVIEDKLNERKNRSGVKYLTGIFTIETNDFNYLFLFNDKDQLISVDISGNKYDPNNDEEWERMIYETNYLIHIIVRNLINANKEGNPQITRSLFDCKLKPDSTAWTHIWTQEQLNQNKEIKAGIYIDSDGNKEMLNSLIRITYK